MSNFQIGRRNLNAENRWENIDINTFKTNKPIVLCFGGRGTVLQRHANYLCKLTSSLVGQLCNEESEVVFLGIVHEKKEEKTLSDLSKEDERKIANKIFVSMCKDENGNLLPNDNIIRAFNKLTFFTHCKGASELFDVINFAKEEMRTLGINSKCIDDAFGQTFAVNYAPLTYSNIPSLNIFSLKDYTIADHLSNPEEKDIISNKFFMLSNQLKDENGNILIKDNEKTLTLISSNLSTGPDDEKNEHSIIFLDRDENWRSSIFDISNQGDVVSQIAGYALATSVASGIKNSTSKNYEPKPTIDQLILDIDSIMEGTKNSSLTKILNKVLSENESPNTSLDPQSNQSSIIESNNSELIH